MELQKMYKDSYVNYLRANISCDLYLQDQYESDLSQTLPIADVYNRAGELRGKMIPDSEHDYDSAIALFEAYSTLSPLVASRPAFWVYLAHNELFWYVQKRRKVNSSTTEKLIKDYWFSTGVAGTLSGLWWAVYMTVDENREDKYELTKALFRNQTFRTRTFFTYRIGKHKEALKGVLCFINDNKELFCHHEEARADYVTTYFNRLDTTKELVYLDQDFFYSELEKKRKAIELATKRDDVRHNRAIWNI